MVAPIEYYALPFICVVYVVAVLNYLESPLKRFITISLGLAVLSALQIVLLEKHLFRPENKYLTTLNFLAIAASMGFAPLVSVISFSYVKLKKPVISLCGGLFCLPGFPIYTLYFVCYFAGNCL